MEPYKVCLQPKLIRKLSFTKIITATSLSSTFPCIQFESLHLSSDFDEKIRVIFKMMSIIWAIFRFLINSWGLLNFWERVWLCLVIYSRRGLWTFIACIIHTNFHNSILTVEELGISLLRLDRATAIAFDALKFLDRQWSYVSHGR